MVKLLVVDDEINIRKMIRKFAEFEGYEVYEAVDGMDAVQKCEEMNYDCIIMDIMMPNLDGFSAVRKIHEFSDVPVIMLSARGEEYDRIHGFEVGVDDYVVKPFSCRELSLAGTYTEQNERSFTAVNVLSGEGRADGVPFRVTMDTILQSLSAVRSVPRSSPDTPFSSVPTSFSFTRMSSLVPSTAAETQTKSSNFLLNSSEIRLQSTSPDAMPQ